MENKTARKNKKPQKALSIIRELLKGKKSSEAKAYWVKKKQRMEENSFEEISEALKQKIQIKAHSI